jgi:hypothetical protein
MGTIQILSGTLSGWEDKEGYNYVIFILLFFL